MLLAMEELTGEQAILDQITETVANGGTPRQLAEEVFGVCVSALWQWMRAVPGRASVYKNALKIQADNLAHESVQDVNSATMDNVPLAKLRADHKVKMAAKWDPETYSDQAGKAGPAMTGITVIVQRDAVLQVEGETLTISSDTPAIPAELSHV